MHNIQYQYDPEDQPSLKEIGILKIQLHDMELPKDLANVAERLGEIIVQIPCKDGICYLIRENYYTLKPGEESID